MNAVEILGALMMRATMYLKFVCSVVICLLCVPHVSADLTDGLVAYYSFDDGEGDVLADGSGVGTDGELVTCVDDVAAAISEVTARVPAHR